MEQRLADRGTDKRISARRSQRSRPSFGKRDCGDEEKARKWDRPPSMSLILAMPVLRYRGYCYSQCRSGTEAAGSSQRKSFLTRCMVRPCVARFRRSGVSGLASKYPVSDWSMCSGPSWYQRACVLSGTSGHQIAGRTGRLSRKCRVGPGNFTPSLSQIRT